jgi:hypothetical protein
MQTLRLIFSLIVLGLPAAGCGGGGGEIPAPSPETDSTAPKVEAYYPEPTADGNVASADIQVNGIKVIFDEAVKAETVNVSSFKVEEWGAGGTPVAGTVSYEAGVRTAKFVPDSALASSWDYAVTITTAVSDLAGNNLAAEHSWTFTVAAPAPPGGVP